MPFKSEHLTELKKVGDKIKSDKISIKQDTLDDFKKYLKDIEDIGRYGEADWDLEWRKAVYAFGRIFKKRDASKVLDILNQAKNEYAKDKVEILEFIYSEIAWNFFDQNNEYISGLFRQLVKKYPGNPEFHHSYSQYLCDNGDFQLSINEAKLALKIEPDNVSFLGTAFNKGVFYVNFLIKKRKIDKAEEILKEVGKIIDGERDVEYNNALVSMQDRINDHRVIEEKIGDIGSMISAAINKERRKLIEILGIFVAILGFVFINVNIALKNLSTHDILLLMFGMAIVLSIFMIVVSYLFSPNNKKDNGFWGFLCERKFYSIIFLLVTLFLIFRCFS